jgi:hypothetical protein
LPLSLFTVERLLLISMESQGLSEAVVSLCRIPVLLQEIKYKNHHRWYQQQVNEAGSNKAAIKRDQPEQ